MKKTLSLMIVVVMLVSMFSFMTTGVSANILKSTYEDAKDGDLLYEVKFGQTSGAYTSQVIHAGLAADNTDAAVTISDDGRTLAFYKPSLTSKSFWYGGKIDGLTWGGDKVYTITMKLSLPNNRGGVYFNYPTAAKEAELAKDPTEVGQVLNTPYSVMYGIYGRFTPEADLGGMLGGGKVAGRFKFDTSNYKEFDCLFVEAGTFLDVTFLIEGYSYAIFVNNNFLDVVDLSEETVKDVCDLLGFNVYLYHIKEDTPMIVKDVNVYKGDTVSANAIYPTYASAYEHYVEAETTTKEATTPAATTKAPATTTPAETTTAAAPADTTKAPATTTAAPEKSGCGSAVTGGLALIAFVSLAGVTVAKKRK